MRFFSYDSSFSQALIKISYACWLNLLWMICSLPVFTVGAATTALYSVTLKIADDAEHNITTHFFRAFRSNFAQATRLWLILLLAGVLLGTDGYVVWHLRASSSGFPAVMWTLNLALIIAAAVVYTIILMYTFPLIARFENTDLAMFKNAFLIGVRYLFATIMIFVIHFAMFYAVVAVFTPLILFGEGLCALLSSTMLINVFRVISVPEDEVSE